MLCLGYVFLVLSGSPEKTKLDKSVEYTASNTCSTTYRTCLKKLTRVRIREYRAICGASKPKGFSIGFEKEG